MPQDQKRKFRVNKIDTVRVKKCRVIREYKKAGQYVLGFIELYRSKTAVSLNILNKVNLVLSMNICTVYVLL